MREPDSFEAFVIGRRRSLLRFAWMLTGDWHLADDLVQTALARCYPRWSRIGEDNPDAYVRKAIVSVHASWWRRRWRGETPTATMPDRPHVDDEIASAELRRTVTAALATLPARQRATVVLRYFEDLTETQTAHVMDCSLGTVKSQTAKALAHLRACGLLINDDSPITKEGSDAVR